MDLRGFAPVGMSSCSSGELVAFSIARLFDRTDDLGRFGGFTELFLQAVSEIFHESFAFGRLRLRADDDRRQPVFQAGSRGKHDDGNDVSSLHLNIVKNRVWRQIFSRRTDY